ncbi:MAG: HAD family hydrolase, partial [Rhizobiales bacterium]|nr:HAD family hydrolase [Hyphomicrobiales bacterium]
PANVDLVIFDCDGVLIDSELISAKILIDELANLGAVVDFEYFREQFLGRSFPKVAQTIRTTFDIELPDDFEIRYRQKLLAEFDISLQPTNGIKNILSQLGVASCVATSSSPQRVERSLSLTQLADHFGENVFTASMVQNGKPAPDLFLLVAKTLGIAPDKCLVIEDSQPGIEASYAAGMQVLHYTGGSHLRGDVAMNKGNSTGLIAFDHWSKFFELAPQLKAEKT